jgi:hypothetical protein
MEPIRLLPKTKRLKELIKLHGEWWKVIDRRSVQCFDNMGIYVESLDGKHKRWIKEWEHENN